MGKPEEYRRYAQECLDLANSFRVSQAQASLRYMAQVWLRLAQQAETQSNPQEDTVHEPG